MSRSHLRVRLEPLPHNWVELPQTLANSLLGSNTSGLLILRLRYVTNADREFYVAWNGIPCREAGCIVVPSKLGEALGMQDGHIVNPEVASGLPVASQVHATVASVDDWEVVESNAEQLSKQLLQQVQVVRKGDTLPIWIRGQSSVNVVIQSAQPADIVLLKNNTIVSIEPPARKTGPGGDNATDSTNDREPSNNASSDTRIRSDRMLADVLRSHQAPGISGPVRLRVKVLLLSAFPQADLAFFHAMPCSTCIS